MKGKCSGRGNVRGWDISVGGRTRDVRQEHSFLTGWMGSGDFLTNSKNLDLGTRWDGLSVHDVKLPPWASDARDFTNKCR